MTDIQELERENRKNPQYVKYAISQDLIDDILANELKKLAFPCHPIYVPNMRGKAVGLTRYTEDILGRTKITGIEIGKRRKPERKELVDTLLHEYYESEIITKQNSDEFYKKLHKMSSPEMHEWIYRQIADFFEKMEEKNELE